jgi:xylono-1,5-lactonase
MHIICPHSPGVSSVDQITDGTMTAAEDLSREEAHCIWPAQAALGEGPMWDARSQALWFVDIKRGRLHRYDPARGDRRTVEVGGAPCFIVPSDDGAFLVGDGHVLRAFDGDRMTGVHATLAMRAGNRLNDGTVAPDGRLWFGSMDDGEREPTGLLYHHDAGEVAAAGGACTITNGPAITRDGRHLYHVDTLGGVIWRFDIGGGPELRDGVEFVRIDPADGTPDGVTVDAEDHVWVGLWGGAQARRYAPDGRLAHTVRFPCDNVTKVAFGGPDLRTGYATTARVGLDDAALARQPLAGGLFAFAVDVPGVILPEARVATAA